MTTAQEYLTAIGLAILVAWPITAVLIAFPLGRFLGGRR